MGINLPERLLRCRIVLVLMLVRASLTKCWNQTILNHQVDSCTQSLTKADFRMLVRAYRLLQFRRHTVGETVEPIVRINRNDMLLLSHGQRYLFPYPVALVGTPVH